MKILQLCHKPPYPPIDGGSIAMYNLCVGLIENGHSVDVLAMNTYKQFCEIEKVPDNFRLNTNYTLVSVDIKIRPLAAVLNLFTKQSYNISRFDSSAYRAQLTQLLLSKKYDFILFDSLFTTPYIDTAKKFHTGPLVLRSHNVEHKIWENLSIKEKNSLKKWYLKLLAKRLKNYELKTIEEIDLIASISNNDIITFKEENCTTEMKYIPFGINFQDSSFKEYTPPEIDKLILFHVGSMEWLPHREAFKWFLEYVWPKFNKLHPEIELHLAGSKMPKWMTDKSFPNVIVTNEYVDGKQFMKDKTIMIVPSFSGSGVRVKVIEGMALGKVIVTTANGALDIPCKHNENIFISDDIHEWVQLLSNAVNNPTKIRKISQNAREFCRKEYDYLIVANRLAETVLKNKKG